jgi:L-ascorbate metabolism protein UlaG (beta-lactamase superfamily)
VILSHLHGDHFDRIARRELDRDTPVVTTGQAARRLHRWGFGACLPLTPWAHTDIASRGQRLRITAVPGRHGPGPVDWLLPEVMGTVLEHRVAGGRLYRLYVTGDVLFRPGLSAVTERFGPLDAMVVHLGGTRLAGVLLTMDARQGADLVELVRPGLTIPVHYDDYGVFRSPLRDFLTELGRRGLPELVQPVRRGETVPLPATVAAEPLPVDQTRNDS